MMRRRVVLVLRVALALVFLFAAYSKLRNPWLLFAMSVDAYHLLPEWAVIAVARGLPWVELALGLLLLSGRFLRQAALVAATLLTVFFAVMLRSYIKGLGIDCACFGFGEALSLKTLLRDGVLVLSSVALVWLSLREAVSRI